jgi:hypothetical protein
VYAIRQLTMRLPTLVSCCKDHTNISAGIYFDLDFFIIDSLFSSSNILGQNGRGYVIYV